MSHPIPSVDQVAHKLGLSASDVASFKSGQVVTQERDASNDKDLCLLIAVTLPASVEKTWQFVLDEKVADCQEANLAEGHINLTTFELEGFTFDHGTAANLSKYNMSSHEAKEFAAAHDKEAAFKKMLSARAKDFWEKGLKGIVPYSGKGHDVADDLETANQAVMKVVDHPEICEEIKVVPSKSKRPACHQMIWNIVQGNSMTSIVLSHRILYNEDGNAFIGMTRKFYSGTDFDSSLITTGVFPTVGDTKCVAFYVNHTFSPAVAGFGGGTKRSVGRKMMKGALVETMKKAQKALAE